MEQPNEQDWTRTDFTALSFDQRKEVAGQIANERKTRNITQEDLERLAGVPVRTISNLETGKTPQAATLRKIADALGSTPRGKPDDTSAPATEQVWQVFDTIAEPYRVAVLLGAFVGLRISEAAGTRIEDIWDETDDGGTVPTFHPKRQWIQPGCRPAPEKVYGPLKTPASRKFVPIPAPVAQMITGLLGGRTGGPLVVREDGKPATPGDINTAVIEAVDKIGGDVARLRFHGFRHYLASIAIANGEDIATVCDRMRHKNPTITLKTYTHLIKTAERRATNAIGREAIRGRNATPLPLAA